MEAETARLRASQTSTADLEALRADHAAVARLRDEIGALRRRAEESAHVAVTMAAAKASEPSGPSILDGPMLSAAWKNAGSATPAATLETVLWAAAGGEVDKLAGLLIFDPAVRTRAEAMFAGLPEQTRAEYGTAERLIATLTARDVPLGSAKLIDPKFEDPTGRKMVVQLYEKEGKEPKHAMFSLRREGEGWRVVVPMNAVDNYASILKGRPANAGAVGVRE